MMNPVKPKKITGTMSPAAAANKSIASGGGGGNPNVLNNWELRPCGMLVQKRNSDSNQNSVSVHTIRVRVKYVAHYHEIHINSQASFGELKKMIAGSTGLHIQDQKLMFKGKERDSKAYLDVSGVKDGSKLVLVEDVLSRERRLLELRRSTTTEKVSKAIAEVSLEVDKLADQVSALQSKISKGGKVVEKDLESLTELLMMQVINLDGIAIDGDLKSQRRMQVKRVQKYIETLDQLKIKISNPVKNGDRISSQQQNVSEKQSNEKVPMPSPMQQQKAQQKQANAAEKPRVFQQQQQPKNYAGSAPVVVTTNWETFDSGVELIPITSKSRFTSPIVNPNAKLNWELFE